MTGSAAHETRRLTVIVVDDGGSAGTIRDAARLLREAGNPVVLQLEDPERMRPPIMLPVCVLGPGRDEVGSILRRQEQRQGFKTFVEGRCPRRQAPARRPQRKRGG